MNWPYEMQIGWRYTRAGRAGRRNGFISFISGVSMLVIALGVAALIIVLSVMNGFQKEVRDRMLSVIAHVEIYDARGAGFADWREGDPEAPQKQIGARAAARLRAQGATEQARGGRGAVLPRAGAARAWRRDARRGRARHLARRGSHGHRHRRQAQGHGVRTPAAPPPGHRAR